MNGDDDAYAAGAAMAFHPAALDDEDEEDLFRDNDSDDDAATVATPEVWNADESVLVTGGAGFVGSHVAEHLLRRGEKVLVIDELNEYEKEFSSGVLPETANHERRRSLQIRAAKRRRLSSASNSREPACNVPPSTRVSQFSSQPFAVKFGTLFCLCCAAQLSTKHARLAVWMFSSEVTWETPQSVDTKNSK